MFDSSKVKVLFTAVGHARLPEDLQRQSLKRMMRTSDGYPLREALTMGSVWWFPSIGSTTTD